MARRTQPNELNKRITIQQKGRTEDEAGYPIPNPQEWEDVFPFLIWAAREPLKGREFFAAAATQYENTIRWPIRFREGIEEGMRVMHNGLHYHIYAVLDDVHGDRTETHLMTIEVT